MIHRKMYRRGPTRGIICLSSFFAEYFLKGGYERICGWGIASDCARGTVPMGYLVAYFFKVEQSEHRRL